MRHAMRALLNMLLVIGCSQNALAESSSWRLWPFGSQEEPATAAQATTAAPKFTPSPSPVLPPSAEITPVGPQPTMQQSAAPVQPPSPELPQTAKDSDRPPVIESPFADFKWPTMKMPEWPRLTSRTSSPGANAAQAETPRNAWVEQQPEPTKRSPLQSLSDGAHRVGNGTRAAWHKTVDVLTPGEPAPSTPPRVASRDTKPPFWKRMFGAQEPQPQGPQTIPQWMAQDRVDP